MSGGVPKRILITQTQRNTPSKAGNPVAKKAIILCNGARSRRAMCNYVMRRAHTETKKEEEEGPPGPPGPPGPDWTYAPDANFRAAVKADYLTVEINEEYFKTSTINTITSLDVHNESISDLTGIEGFAALLTLLCNENQLTTLDVSANTVLTDLDCNNNLLTTINVSANTALTDLHLQSNLLTTLDVSANTALYDLDCQSNSLTTLDVSANTALGILLCTANSLTTLDVSANTVLIHLDCNNNSLTTLDVSANTALTQLYCQNNSLTTLDVSANTVLAVLQCANNDISGNSTNYITTSWTGTFSGTFDATPQNVAATGNFCKVADADAVTHFTAEYLASIPAGTSYFYDPVWTGQLNNRADLLKAIDWWIEGGEYKTAVTNGLGVINSWDTSGVNDMSSAFDNGRVRAAPLGGFLDSTTFNDSISNWDTAAVTDMGEMFKGAAAFDQAIPTDVNKWDTSSVTSWREMFSGATTFNQNLISWNTQQKVNMNSMFNGATLFNNAGVALGWQNLFLVTDMSGMFKDATSFNSDISGWMLNVVSTMSHMFNGASSFNKDITEWTTSSVTNMSSMFEGAASFDNNGGGYPWLWDVQNVTNMSKMFKGAEHFQSNIGYYGPFPSDVAWDTRNVTDMSEMFMNATSFNQNVLGNLAWPSDAFTVDVSGTAKVTTMESMFEGANAFKNSSVTFAPGSGVGQSTIGRPIGEGGVSFKAMFKNNTNNFEVFGPTYILKNNFTEYCNNMSEMFMNTTNFNNEIGPDWDTSNVTDMSSMFEGASAFNNSGLIQNMGDWNVQNVTNMSGMFQNATAFNRDLSDWDISGVTNMSSMFEGAILFNEDLSDWDTSGVTNMSSMFKDATLFNQDLSLWNISSVTTSANLEGCFNGATALNQTFIDGSGGTWYTTAEALAAITDITDFYTDGTDYPVGGVVGKQPKLVGWSLFNVTDVSGQMFIHSSIEAVGGKIYIVYTWSADIYAKDAEYELHFVYSNDEGQNWSTPQVIDDNITDQSLRGNSIAVDASGTVYVCYTRFGAFVNNPDLKFAYRTALAGTWQVQIRKQNIGIEPAPSIAVQQSTGTLFISYYNETTPAPGTNGCLETFRSTDSGATWPTPLSDPSGPNPILADGGGVNGAPGNGNTGQHSSITTAQGSSDNKNYVYICYHSRTLPNNQIMVVRSEDDGLTYTTPRNISLTNAQDTALYPSIYVTDIVDDTNGKVYVSYNYETTDPSYVIYVASWTNNAVPGGAGADKVQITGAEGPSPGGGTGVATTVAAYGSTVYVSYGYVETPTATERPLYLATSTDGGATWNPLEVIDSTPGGPAYAPIRYTPSMNMIDGGSNPVISYPGPGTLVDGYDVKMAKYS